jgi:hypothetical protein
MSESALQRLIELSASLPAALMKEQREIVHKLAHELHVPLDSLNDSDHADAAPETTKRNQRESVDVSSARDKFQKQEQQQQQQKQEQQASMTRKEARKSIIKSPPAAPTTTGNSDCDISSQEIKDAYMQVRDDSSPVSWLSMGYGSSKKVLSLYGTGQGGLKDFASTLKDDEITYGYVRMIYGDSQRSKFVFVAYVPEGLSILTKARANTHKPVVTQYLKYMHTDVFATTLSELDEDTIQAKLKAAAGANYGTGGTAAAGSEDYGSVKDNAKNFFQQTEGKGSRISIVYNQGPLADTTPVTLTGRAGITEKYITK